MIFTLDYGVLLSIEALLRNFKVKFISFRKKGTQVSKGEVCLGKGLWSLV